LQHAIIAIEEEQLGQIMTVQADAYAAFVPESVATLMKQVGPSPARVSLSRTKEIAAYLLAPRLG